MGYDPWRLGLGDLPPAGPAGPSFSSSRLPADSRRALCPSQPRFLVSVQILDGIAGGISGMLNILVIADLTRGMLGFRTSAMLLSKRRLGGPTRRSCDDTDQGEQCRHARPADFTRGNSSGQGRLKRHTATIQR